MILKQFPGSDQEEDAPSRSLSLEILSCLTIFHVSSTVLRYDSEPLMFYFYPVHLTAEAGSTANAGLPSFLGRRHEGRSRASFF
jgi:hypothetical protein